MSEYESHQYPAPDALPPELVAAIAGVEYACLTIGTEAGTMLLLKAPRIEIESTRGRVLFTAGNDLDRYVIWDYVSRKREIIG